jgi:hypothetical protein
LFGSNAVHHVEGAAMTHHQNSLTGMCSHEHRQGALRAFMKLLDAFTTAQVMLDFPCQVRLPYFRHCMRRIVKA